jgi:hypothetical protein
MRTEVKTIQAKTIKKLTAYEKGFIKAAITISEWPTS